MDREYMFKLLQTIYVGVLADVVFQLGKEGCLESVTNRKKEVQMLSSKKMAELFGISSPEEVFTKFRDLFDCTAWTIDKKSNGFIAKNLSCKLLSMTKKAGAPCPCNIYCLNPVEGIIKGLDNDLKFNVKDTLCEGNKCLIEVIK